MVVLINKKNYYHKGNTQFYVSEIYFQIINSIIQI